MGSKKLLKIKSSSAKSIAKNILSSKTGKKISDTKFKSLMKQDKNLKKFAYASKSSTMAKHQAKKFFSKVVAAANKNEGFKINTLAAKKMGVRINKQGEVSNIGLNNIYQKASAEQLAGQEPTGPSPQEIRRQKKREDAISLLHKQDRSRQTMEEHKKEDSAGKKDKSSEKKSSAPPPRTSAGGSSSSGGSSQQGGQSTGQQSNTAASSPIPTSRSSSPARTTNQNTESIKIPVLLITPLNNLSKNVAGLEIIINKIDSLAKQSIKRLNVFKIVEEKEISNSLYQLRIKKFPTSADQDIIKKIAELSKADLFTFGQISKTGKVIKINIDIINTFTGQKLNITNLKDEHDDFFELSRKIDWQIKNVLQGESMSGSDDKNQPPDSPPSTDEIIELPI